MASGACERKQRGKAGERQYGERGQAKPFRQAGPKPRQGQQRKQADNDQWQQQPWPETLPKKCQARPRQRRSNLTADQRLTVCVGSCGHVPVRFMRALRPSDRLPPARRSLAGDRPACEFRLATAKRIEIKAPCSAARSTNQRRLLSPQLLGQSVLRAGLCGRSRTGPSRLRQSSQLQYWLRADACRSSLPPSQIPTLALAVAARKSPFQA